MKTRAEINCHSLNRQIVMLRDKRCQIPWCETPLYELSNHHLFNRSQGNYEIIHDPDFCVILCMIHHNFVGEHQEEFWDKIIPMIRSKDEARADKILKWKNSPKPPQREKADYKEIEKKLAKRLTEQKEKSAMEPDDIYRGRAI